MPNITIHYDGRFPNLCSGRLIAVIDGAQWIFPEYCLSSGGSVYFKENWEEVVTSGPWSITRWPPDFPEDLKKPVLDAVNAEVPHGCCGGCV